MVPPTPAGRPRQRRRATRWLVLGVLGVALCLIGAGAWFAWSAQQARSELEETRSSLSGLRDALSAADLPQAREELDRARAATDRAQRLTHGPLWAVTPLLPVVGDAASVARGLSASAEQLVIGPVTALVESAAVAPPDELLASGGRVDVGALRTVAPALTEAARTTHVLRRDVAALPADSGFAAVDRARTGALRQLRTVADAVAGAAQAARVAPGMLGADGPRRYLLVFQNSAESRGTGGILGAYGVLAARDGKLKVTRLGSNKDLERFAAPVLDLGAEFDARYNGFGATRVWSQANPSPHFPYAARIWLAMWQEQTGVRLDGVIATDPVGLAHLLEATGPVRLPDGERITAANAVSAVLQTAYARFPDPAEQDVYFQEVAEAALGRALAGDADPRALARQLRLAAEDGRIQVYSTDEEAQEELEGTVLGGVLPQDPGPFAQLVVNNIAASKLDYYLERSLRYTALTGCDADSRETRIGVRLTNSAPESGLPAYVTNNLDEGLTPGTTRLLVSIYLAQGAGMDSVRIDGKPAFAALGQERQHPVVVLPLDIAPGVSRTVTLDVVEPTSGRRARVPVQPLVQPQRTVAEVPPCSPGPGDAATD